jgi:hypothetical protein
MSNVSGVLVGLVARTLLLWQILLQEWAATDWAFWPFVKGNGAIGYATPTLRNRLSLSGWRSRDQRCKLSKVLGDGARTNSSRSHPGPPGYRATGSDGETNFGTMSLAASQAILQGCQILLHRAAGALRIAIPAPVLTYDRALLVGIRRNRARIGLGANEAATLAHGLARPFRSPT